MNMASTVKIRIKPGGKVEISVQGIKGPTCTDITKLLQKALGETTSEKKTNDFFEEQVTTKIQQY
jgi:hypothetical protein